MLINNIKINGFGKLKDKDINLKNGINIIYGENEAGKSTLLKYITAILYGLTKNKKGGNIPEIEKYEPWNSQEFSGRLSYTLDNGEYFEVYRDFRKKNPKIFNQNLEDISKTFSIDKTKGIKFIYDQIGVEEEIFEKSAIVRQAEVKLEEKEQNELIQKISNILGTGEDATSYTTVMNKLKKKLNDEVGTQNTKEKPINLAMNRIDNLIKEKKELEEYQLYKFDIEEKVNDVSLELEERKQELSKFKNAKIEYEKLSVFESKIKANEDIIQNIEKDIENLENQINDKKETPKQFSKVKITITTIAIILINIISFLLLKGPISKLIVPILTLISLIIIVLIYIKNKNKLKEENRKNKKINTNIEVLKNNKDNQLKILEQARKEYSNELNKLNKEFNLEHYEDVLESINNVQNILNNKTIQLHTLELDRNNVIPKLERLVNIEEELEKLSEEKEELEIKGENINRAIRTLEIAYYKMKERITPKFTLSLSNIMNKITNGKYKNIQINASGNIIIEDTNGKYIDAENLSIGTIDQIYLSLRIATIKEITNESIPIILDEAFAYYDKSRLENILKFLHEEYSNNQIIIFTCTNREKECLEDRQYNYNFIYL